MRKGISPLISVVLLVGLTVTIIIIITVWSTTLAEENIGVVEDLQEKFNLRNLNLEVQEIRLDVGPAAGRSVIMTITNNNAYQIDSIMAIALSDQGDTLGVIDSSTKIKPYGIEDVQFNLPPGTTKAKLLAVVIINEQELTIPIDLIVKIPQNGN